ncbi:tetrahydrofolate dehydrogenase/cyclohydrolase catalytic domain-containing protein, partial [Sagittula sp. SSi028]|uniref:tetrahydrofolate dehydrogenase/cyclohydrolase catalytic domain-containing protein n=1 Tax=Sagittula sp. SSi028 TaxID=3400636 RepID=UPI003AF5462A
MTATVIDGKAFAATVRQKVAGHVARLREEHGITPGLAVVLVGEDPASQVYVRSKGKMTVEVGMNSFEHKLDADTSEADLLALIDRLNADPAVHGILVQLPLPQHLNEDLVINAIDPAKDVDGFHISNVGLLGTGQKSMVPCTPLGCLMMLR